MYKRNHKREYSEYEKKLHKYYWTGFISEFSKICIFLIVFALLELTPEYLIALFTLMSLRCFGGGLHFNHYVSCLGVSFAFLFSSIFLSAHIVPTQFIVCISMILCSLIGYVLVPVTSTNRPPATSEQIKKSKKCTVIIILFYFILVYICSNTTWAYICYWTVILHILQLIIAHAKKEVNKNV